MVGDLGDLGGIGGIGGIGGLDGGGMSQAAIMLWMIGPQADRHRQPRLLPIPRTGRGPPCNANTHNLQMAAAVPERTAPVDTNRSQDGGWLPAVEPPASAPDSAYRCRSSETTPTHRCNTSILRCESSPVPASSTCKSSTRFATSCGR